MFPAGYVDFLYIGIDDICFADIGGGAKTNLIEIILVFEFNIRDNWTRLEGAIAGATNLDFAIGTIRIILKTFVRLIAKKTNVRHAKARMKGRLVVRGSM